MRALVAQFVRRQGWIVAGLGGAVDSVGAAAAEMLAGGAGAEAGYLPGVLLRAESMPCRHHEAHDRGD
jgi:hypothetical protein